MRKIQQGANQQIDGHVAVMRKDSRMNVTTAINTMGNKPLQLAFHIPAAGSILGLRVRIREAYLLLIHAIEYHAEVLTITTHNALHCLANVLAG